ncbi:hypothetical protein [Desulfosediminicola flagellatus]|uniref:hypothetical protein n=1 Tax=Desulfosediminicola flagellatus TaxID=2569541 RepID=UPI0010ABA0A0|nr:hypothetical protein [Desulfosediminicola flagellatus]
MEAELKHLEDVELANGVVVRFYNESRRVAGDRWQVNVRYDAVVPVSEAFWSLVSGEPELIDEIRATLGSEIVLTNLNERNFISEEEKEPLIAEIVNRARENMLGYFADPSFPESYFKRRFKEAREEIERKKREVWVEDNDDTEEPDDFSHLFSDVKKSD